MARAAFLLAIVFLLIASARSFLPEESSLVGSGASLAFGFVLLAALQTGTLFSGLKLPKLTGYLTLGFLAGPGVLNFVTSRMVSDLRLINNVAIGLIALSAGSELNLRSLRPRLASVLGISAASLVLTTAACASVLYILPELPFVNKYVEFLSEMTKLQRGSVALLMGVVIACLSPMVVIALINETGARGPFCETALGIVVIADLLILLIFSGASALAVSVFGDAAGAAGAGHAAAGVRGLLVHIFGSFGVGAVVGALFVFYLKRVNQRTALFAFGVCFFCAEAGTRLHLSPLLMCLTAGLVIENLSDVEGSKLIHDIEPARMPVFAVFFAVAGAGLHWHAVQKMVPVVVILVVVRMLTNGLGATLGALFGNLPSEHKRLLPAVLFPQSGVAIGLSILVEKQFPGWGPQASTCLLGVIMTNEMIGPVALRAALVRSGETGKREPMSGVAVVPEH
jgi:Kef-type K+ transport system membrane component KefB